ncbi:hypothetical protein [Tolypothrix sp. VBCCA 56010]|uniref:hypothetical protein n=1 Tax=Tolypothrix sp. VBCCA 56010 TaxID=3137731 RepID=UPI003D7D4991
MARTIFRLLNTIPYLLLFFKCFLLQIYGKYFLVFSFRVSILEQYDRFVSTQEEDKFTTEGRESKFGSNPRYHTKNPHLGVHLAIR